VRSYRLTITGRSQQVLYTEVSDPLHNYPLLSSFPADEDVIPRFLLFQEILDLPVPEADDFTPLGEY